jgi:hypothetical protein
MEAGSRHFRRRVNVRQAHPDQLIQRLGMGGVYRFKNWEEGIVGVSKGLRENYMNDGLTTPEQIGRRYAASPSWPWKVRFFLKIIEEFTPSSSATLPVEL